MGKVLKKEIGVVNDAPTSLIPQGQPTPAHSGNFLSSTCTALLGLQLLNKYKGQDARENALIDRVYSHVTNSRRILQGRFAHLHCNRRPFLDGKLEMSSITVKSTCSTVYSTNPRSGGLLRYMI